jgi:hypothetical protein
MPPSADADDYDLDHLGDGLRKALRDATAAMRAAKSPLEVLQAIRSAAKSFVAFDDDLGYDASVAHLIAVGRDLY